VPSVRPLRFPCPLALALLLAALAPGAAQAADPPGRIGPDLQVTGNGRQLHPIGSLTTLGNFPTAGALTPDGRFYWTVDAGHGKNDVQVTDVASGAVVQTLPLPGGFGGVGFTPDGRRAFVSGSAVGSSQPSGPTKGDKGDVIHVFDVDPASGRGTEREAIALPAGSGGSGQQNSLPPVSAQYPSVLAVSPDGGTVAVALQQSDRVALLPVAGGTGKSVQVGRYPGGVAWDRDGRAYVSNALDGTVSVVDAGTAKVVRTISGLGGFNAQPEGLVADPRSDRMYVAITQRDAVGVIDTKALTVVKTVSVARPEAQGVQPTSLAVDPDGETLYVTDSGEDAIAAIALTDRVTAGRAGTSRTSYRPPSVVALRGYQAAVRVEARRYKADRKRAQGRSAKRRATRRHASRVDRLHRTLLKTARVRTCAGPTRLQARRYRLGVLRALRGSSRKRTAALRRAQKALPAILRCAAAGAIPGLKQYELIGKLPVAAYPTAVAVTPDGRRLLWVAGKGFGAGPNPDFVFAGDKRAFGKVETPYGTYVPDKLLGRLGRLSRPTDTQARAMTKAAEAQTRPADAVAPPAGTTVRKDGPIKHVFYVVRENRTYDQIFGSDPRGDGQADLELFGDNGKPAPVGGITPNAHALTRTFPLLDHVYANSEVSVDGHLITAGSIANDYTQKGTAQNYADRGKSFDFGVFPITFGPNAFVLDQAVRQKVSFRNYGEGAAGTLPVASEGRPTYDGVVAGTDNAYPGNLQIGCLRPQPGTQLAACTQDSGSTGTAGSVTATTSRYNQFAPQFTQQVASGTVPAFNYVLLPNDHTNGTAPNAYSPQALIADNDLALGQIVDLISHSSIWASSAIFVVEDDTQDGADHVDAHRMPALVISPYAKRGVAVHDRFDQYSFLRTAELLAGLDPLSINDALATPLYAAFNATPDVDGTRFTAIRPEQSLTEVNPAAAPMSALSRALPFEQMDLVPQVLMDRVLWASVHGTGSRAPRSGPNASPEEHERALGALRALARGGDARAWLRANTENETEAEGETGEAASGPLTPAVRAAAAAEARGILDRLGAKG
jgi:YVTN family beta-propeller protein